MFPIAAIAICVLELLYPHLYDVVSDDAYYTLWQLEIVLLMVMAVFSTDTQRDKSVMTVFLLWFSWQVSSGLFLIAQSIPTSLEASAFTAFVLWALIRPYAFTSDDRVERNVCIAFYRGTHAPFLSSLSALVGLPFSSVAIVTGNTALRASGCGKMVLSDASALMRGNDFVCINTGIEGSPDVIQAIHECVGKSTRTFGGLRTRCVSNLLPVLKTIGYEPRTIFHKIPSVFYYQCVGKAHGN